MWEHFFEFLIFCIVFSLFHGLLCGIFSKNFKNDQKGLFLTFFVKMTKQSPKWALLRPKMALLGVFGLF